LAATTTGRVGTDRRSVGRDIGTTGVSLV